MCLPQRISHASRPASAPRPSPEATPGGSAPAAAAPVAVLYPAIEWGCRVTSSRV